jgi:hypothetical protein
MNFREGMRRIGLTVGVMGALVTALAAFGLFFSDLADHRKAQAEFNSLLKLPIIQGVAKTMAKKKTIGPNFSEQQPQNWDTTNEIRAHLADGSVLHFPGGTHPNVIHDIVQKQYGQIPASAPPAQGSSFDPLETARNAVVAKKKISGAPKIQPQSNDVQVHLEDGTTLHFPPGIGQDEMQGAVQKFVQQRQLPPGTPPIASAPIPSELQGPPAYDQTQIPNFDDFVKERQRNGPTSAYVEIQGHPQGIKQFWVDEKGEIAWFEMDDGRTITRTAEPTSLFWYLLYPPIMAVGFVLPWGAVRLVTWIVSGFIRSGATAPQKA